jgi:hypothetical protein
MISVFTMSSFSMVGMATLAGVIARVAMDVGGGDDDDDDDSDDAFSVDKDDDEHGRESAEGRPGEGINQSRGGVSGSVSPLDVRGGTVRNMSATLLRARCCSILYEA